MKRNITIHDLARELGIDSSTVSRALSDSPRVGAKTKERVKAKAKELGYQRNLLASNLRTSKTMTIGVVVPFISRHFFSEAIDGIEQVASEKGYRVIISQSRDSFSKEKEILDGMFMNRVDGLLVSPTQDTRDGEHLNQFVENKIPVVLFDRFYENSNLSKVVLADRKATYMITEHLIKQGKKKIFHLAGDLESTMYKERCLGYKNAMFDNGIQYEENYIKSIELYADTAVEALKEFLEDKNNIPDAIVCVNDVTALAIMKYISEKTDYNVPEDIAIAGFSNEPASDIINPGLTTVDQHPFEIGKTSSEMLFDFVKDGYSGQLSSKTVVIQPELIVRGSTTMKLAVEY
ncbi:MAG: LacI family DNA-binding transcriptional regulator [Flavobacteriales bacterium]|nr:LacI family DNA-binding transcriptional regulator [Flavobacteriales bacterium]